MNSIPAWCSSWWFRKLNTVFHIFDSTLEPPEQYHQSFIDQYSVLAYAYEGKPNARIAMHHDTRHPPAASPNHNLDDVLLNDCASVNSSQFVITTAVDVTSANRRATLDRDSS
jgi:hypothetical protein